ncbi:MAG: cell wall biosynthesis protein [Methanosphaera sp.]|nr:cell wall biosynthesis protein [Methanosphaera sp.]
MEIYMLWIIGLILTLILTTIFTVLFTKIKGNLFEDIRGGIPKGVGLAPFIVMVLLFPKPYNYLIGIIGITAFIDDLIGRKKLTSYLEVGQLFRGLGIIIVMLWGFYIMGPIAILVALMVQIFNIADMEPGVACITVLIMSIVSFTILILMHSSSYYLPVLLFVICLGYISQDYSGYIMMGEVGNHSFGVALGICFALVSSVLAKAISPVMFYPVGFILMIILFLLTAMLIAYLRRETLSYYLERYLGIENPNFGDFVMDVLTGGGLGDLFRKLILGDKQITVTNSLAIALGARRLVYNPVKAS